MATKQFAKNSGMVLMVDELKPCPELMRVLLLDSKSLSVVICHFNEVAGPKSHNVQRP